MNEAARQGPNESANRSGRASSEARASLRQLLLDTAARLFETASDDAAFEQVEEGRFPASGWRALEESGLVDMLLPENAGGAGVGFGDAMAVARLAGSFALPMPLVETMLGRRLLFEVGQKAPAGPLGVLTAAGPALVTWPDDISALVVADAAGGVGCVAARDVDFEAGSNSAGEATGWLSALPRVPDLGSRPRPAAPDASALMAVARAALIAGAMERVLDLTIEHVRGRVQFGRPLARFQAVQQLVAVLASQVAVVGVAADSAALTVDAALCRSTAGAPGSSGGAGGAGRDIGLAAACAKARASEACREVTRIAHQLHGAIGYTREHDLHRFTRRLWAWRDADGDEGYWQRQVGEMALRSKGDGLWPLLAGA